MRLSYTCTAPTPVPGRAIGTSSLGDNHTTGASLWDNYPAIAHAHAHRPVAQEDVKGRKRQEEPPEGGEVRRNEVRRSATNVASQAT